MVDLTDISYLKSGSNRQRAAFNLLIKSDILDFLNDFDPILAGTIPLNIDIEGSDLDIICHWKNKREFTSAVIGHFAKEKNFEIREMFIDNQESVIANFSIKDFEIEIFGQNIPSDQQNAYRHMLIEYRILEERGEDFRAAIMGLKRNGIKTEPAFAQLLGLSGDPYQAMLDFDVESFSNGE